MREDKVVTVTCLAPNILIGDMEVTCQSKGWSVVPNCRKLGKYKILFVSLAPSLEVVEFLNGHSKTLHN